MKVIYRKDKHTKEIVAFLPDYTVRWGNIMIYVHLGQHSETDVNYYLDTIKADYKDYIGLHNELKQIYQNELSISNKLYRKWLKWI